MSKILKDLDDLLTQGIITQDVSDRIRNYYQQQTTGANRMVIAFGIIGALLVGMGTVLIIAHNWDDLSNNMKLAIGFTPLLVSQLLAGYILVRDLQSTAWREAVAVVLIFSVATSIAIVSQVYNLGGDLPDFLLVWMALCIPIPYLLRSGIASLLCWIGSTWYGMSVGFNIFFETEAPVIFWAFALTLLPYYIMQVRKAPGSNTTGMHAWVVALSLTPLLALTRFDADDILVPAYATMFSCFILIGQLPVFATRKLLSNGWLVVGSGGMIIFLLYLTFEWPDLAGHDVKWWLSPEFFIWLGLFAGASFLLHLIARDIGYKNVLSKSYTFIAFIPLMIIGMYSAWFAQLLVNVMILVLGVYTIREGAQANRLWQMNYGMLILSLLILCRFFDTNMSFVLRGFLFIAIGAGFFGMNYYMVNKRKQVQA